jgi:integrase
MARRTVRRHLWRRTRTGTWTCSLGTRGTRVRLFQKRVDGPYYREVHVPGEGRDQAPLGTYDRAEAERLGQQLLARMLSGVAPQPDQPVRLSELWTRYERECPSYRDNTLHARRDAASRAPVLLGHFGEDFDVRTLTAVDVQGYQAARRAGGIRCGPDRVTAPVRQRSVHADLALLRAMLRWAAGVRVGGGRWLDRNPLEGVRFEREPNPVRPVATWEQFLALRAQLRRLAENAVTDALRARWTRVELALVLAEATGRRRGAIVGLKWEDIDFSRGTIRWRAEYDKKRMEREVPVPTELLRELRSMQTRLGAATGWLFPRSVEADGPLPAEMLSQWLADAIRRGRVAKSPGGLWHTYRRKWASERMHHPIKAVAEAGGWKDVATLLSCYQHADAEMLLAVMAEPTKRCEPKRQDLQAMPAAASSSAA